MSWRIRKYFLIIFEFRRAYVFVKNYVDILLFIFRDFGNTNLKLTSIFELMSISRYRKLYRVFRLCSKLNFENDLIIRKSLLNNLTSALNFIDVPNFDKWEESKVITWVNVKGWVDSNYLPISLNMSSKNFDLKTNLKRMDVATQSGLENLYSGFNAIIDIQSFYNIVWEVPSKLEPDVKKKLYPASSVPTQYFKKTQSSLDTDVGDAGFIDEIKVFWSPKSVISNLDFLFFVNLVNFLNLDFTLRFVDHQILDRYYALLACTDFNTLETKYINTKAVEKVRNLVPISKNIEFFKYNVQSDTSPRMFRLTNVRLIRGKFLVDEKNFLINEFSDSLDSDLISGVNTDLFTDFKNESVTGCYTSSEYTLLKNAIVLPSLVNNNWFHFVVESLAILVWFKDKLSENFPILLMHDTNKNIVSFLKLFGFNEILFIQPDVEFRIENLITFSKNAIIVDSLTKNLNSFKINSDLVLNLRDRISDLFSLNLNKNLQQEFFFFRRNGSSRALILKVKSLKFLKKLGVESVSIGKYSLNDQIRISSKADVLLIEGGASLTNFLFIKSNCKVLYFTNEMLGDYKLPEYFGSIFGLSVKVVTGRLKFSSVFKSNNNYDLFHSNYSMSASRLKKHLSNFNID